MHDHGKCADAVERLYHYLDGELDEARMALVKSHLDECLPCLEAFDFEAELRQLVARKCREVVPEALRVRITLALQAEYGAGEGFGLGMPPFA
ncbi:MAG: mycothiol system anti-sigma-R factor [Acidimicrobiales bacterium]